MSCFSRKPHTSFVDFQWVVELPLPASITRLSLPLCQVHAALEARYTLLLDGRRTTQVSPTWHLAIISAWSLCAAKSTKGLQAIEHWNSANDFILYGKGGEFASNRIEDQELAMLSLHLLQVSLVYINTLMIQQVLAEPAWQDRVTVADLRALTPLLWAHVYPYGTFTLNMRERLPLAQGSVTAEATWPKFRPSLPRGLWAKRGWEGSAGQCWPRP